MEATRPSCCSPYTTDELTEAFNEANPKLSPEEQRVALTLYELLALGRPVGADELARRAGADESWVRERLDEWSGVFRDGDGSVIGFWGLSVHEMPHALELDGTTVYTWCAFDPLFIAPILGKTGFVETTCPVSGTSITLTVDADGVRDVDPPRAVGSFLKPEEGMGDDIVERFCHYIYLFASPEHAEAWVAQHPGTFVISIEEAFDIGRRTLGRLSGSRTS